MAVLVDLEPELLGPFHVAVRRTTVLTSIRVTLPHPAYSWICLRESTRTQVRDFVKDPRPTRITLLSLPDVLPF